MRRYVGGNILSRTDLLMSPQICHKVAAPISCHISLFSEEKITFMRACYNIILLNDLYELISNSGAEEGRGLTIRSRKTRK